MAFFVGAISSTSSSWSARRQRAASGHGTVIAFITQLLLHSGSRAASGHGIVIAFITQLLLHFGLRAASGHGILIAFITQRLFWGVLLDANRTRSLLRMDYLLRQLHRESSRRREDIAEVIYLRTSIRIPVSAFRVIHRLRSKPARVSDLATELGESLPTVTRLVQQLAARGLVKRTRDETDGRASIVRLSPLGLEMDQTIYAERLDFMSCVLNDWSDGQLGELLPLLEKLAADFTEHVGFAEPWEEYFANELAQADESI